MPRAAIYISAAKDMEAQEMDQRLGQLRSFVDARHWQLIHIYWDAAHNGTPPHTHRAVPAKIGSPMLAKEMGKRPAYEQMLTDIGSRRFEVLLFWSLSQLSREGTVPTIKFLQRLTDMDIRYRSFAEPCLDTCGAGRESVLCLLSLLAAQERVRISEHTKIGMERMRRSGMPGPKGYLAPGRPRATFDEEKARSLRASGLSYEKIARACQVSKATIYRFFPATQKARKEN